jgi:ATP-dependent RNA helicase MRH4
MVEMFDDAEGVGEFNVSKVNGHGVDVLVGTPMKLLEMFRGRGWDKIREEEKEEENDERRRGFS